MQLEFEEIILLTTMKWLKLFGNVLLTYVWKQKVVFVRCPTTCANTDPLCMSNDVFLRGLAAGKQTHCALVMVYAWGDWPLANTDTLCPSDDVYLRGLAAGKHRHMVL